ncbi:MAG: hypothetical protein K1X56_08260 [Flavobacteriales bacterium]|nr:hypothetical protein [Flavobacteriales bacterium]
MIEYIFKWSMSENNNTVAESSRNEKVEKLFQKSTGGLSPSPWFMI